HSGSKHLPGTFTAGPSGPDQPDITVGSRLGRVDLLLAELLDVDVLEREHLDVLGETGGPAHVPYPGVGHRDLEEDVSGLGPRFHVDLVAEVETAVGLHDVLEYADDVAVLPIEGQLHLGLVLLEILRTHADSPRV